MTTEQEQIQINRAAYRLNILSATERVGKVLTPEQEQEKAELQKFLEDK